ncbi:MAG TPA: hypothetical protein VGO55_18335 [Allosphingosinicella sp.]|jgi:hypothetical protein|nr:hypothetical protein [Allosphingosinicella sp.]
MSDGDTFLMVLAALVVALAMLSLAALRGWEGWLQVRRIELVRGRGPRRAPTPAAARLELADLRDRVRRLEAIANGVEG